LGVILTKTDDLAPSQAANPGREIHFQTLRARAPERFVVRKNDVAATLANLSPVLENFHYPESRAQNTVGTAGCLVRCFRQGQTLPQSVVDRL
jgi:hypothetical protein